MNNLIQDKWKAEEVIGYDCITYGDGRIIIANTYSVIKTETSETVRYWFPLCDTTLEGIQKYDEDVWTATDIYWGGFSSLDHKQTFVFGPGAMGNEGYVASVNNDNTLKWSIFFTFSNPIMSAEIKDSDLLCYGETGCVIKINLNNLTEIEVIHKTESFN